jgi:hypothetical protein
MGESEEEPAAHLHVSIRQEEGAALLIVDGTGAITRTLGAADAAAQQGYLVFTLDPSALPNPVTLNRRSSDGCSDVHLAGPCDPGALRDALVAQQWAEVDALVGGPPADAPDDPAAPPAADGDDPIDDGNL